MDFINEVLKPTFFPKKVGKEASKKGISNKRAIRECEDRGDVTAVLRERRGNLVKISNTKSKKALQTKCFLELVIRIELMTSSLPMTCSTD